MDSTTVPPTCRNRVLEGRFCFHASRPFIDEGDDVFTAVLCCPFGDDPGLRTEQKARTDEVGRASRGYGRSRTHDECRLLGLRHKLCDREGRGCDADSADINSVVGDHFLNHPARSVGHPGIIADDDLSLPIGDDVAVLLHIELDAALSRGPTVPKPGPVIGMLIPIFRAFCASTAGANTLVAVAAAMPLRTVLRSIVASTFPPALSFF